MSHDCTMEVQENYCPKCIGDLEEKLRLAEEALCRIHLAKCKIKGCVRDCCNCDQLIASEALLKLRGEK